MSGEKKAEKRGFWRSLWRSWWLLPVLHVVLFWGGCAATGTDGERRRTFMGGIYTAYGRRRKIVIGFAR